MDRGKYYKLTEEVRKDIRWCYLYLPQFTGTSILWLLDVFEVDAEFASDACLVALGAVCQNEYICARFPQDILQVKGTNITHLELWAVIIGVRTWGPKLRGKIIRVKTDNEAVAHIVNSGWSQDALLQKQLRELVWWLARCEFKIKSVYLPGKSNVLPDILSRWHEGEMGRRQFCDITAGRDIRRLPVLGSWFQFSHDW